MEEINKKQQQENNNPDSNQGILLKFQSEKELAGIAEAQPINKVVWHYEDTENELYLNLDSKSITCPAMNIDKPVNEWKVNQENASMTINELDSYENIKFEFLASMLGQVLDQEKFLQYFKVFKDFMESEQEN